jgi:hypothetical protein
MKTKRNAVLGFVGLLVLALSLAIAAPHSVGAAPPNANVIVENTSANPVPTTAVGTVPVAGSVSIDNQPTVSAQQSGSWSVGIDGTASVSVANQPTVSAEQSGGWSVGIVGTPNVNIANTPSVSIAGTPTVAIAGGMQVNGITDVRLFPDGLTHLRRRASDHVTLIHESNFGLNGIVADDFRRMHQDGTFDSTSFVVPFGSVLVVTDVFMDFEGLATVPYLQAELGIELASGLIHPVFGMRIPVAADGTALGGQQLVSGFVVGSGNKLAAYVGIGVGLVIHGYLASDE